LIAQFEAGLNILAAALMFLLPSCLLHTVLLSTLSNVFIVQIFAKDMIEYEKCILYWSNKTRKKGNANRKN